MDRPNIAQKSPYLVEVDGGETYYWCACGLSKNQPFCDGSHKTTSFAPTPYTAQSATSIAFCGCKQTKNRPTCDGSHKSL